MNVSLTPELEQLVNEKVRTGLYQTASEVVREALRLLKQRDDETRRADQQAVLASNDVSRRTERHARSRRPATRKTLR
jgi:antitoxin ParD1/3/4